MGAKEKGKVVDLEAEEGAEDIDAEGVDPITKLLEYIPPTREKLRSLRTQMWDNFSSTHPCYWRT